MSYKEVDIKGYKCDNCGYLWYKEEGAKGCCKDYNCRVCGIQTKKYWTICDKCKEKEDLDKATKMTLEEWLKTNPAYMFYYDENYYFEIEDVLEEAYFQGKDPNYVWGTEKIEVKIHSDILRNMEEDSDYEDLEFAEGAYKAFDTFADEWNVKWAEHFFMPSNVAILIPEEIKIKAKADQEQYKEVIYR